MIETPEQAAWYLAGIIDGEGHVCSKPHYHYIQITNTDESIISATQEALDLLDIEYRTYDKEAQQDTHQDFWRIVIGKREALETLADHVELQSEKKQRALVQIVNSPYGKNGARWRPNDSRIAEVRKLYWEHGLSVRDIATRMGVSKGKIEKVMVRYDIPTRERLEAVRHGRRVENLSESHKAAISSGLISFHKEKNGTYA